LKLGSSAPAPEPAPAAPTAPADDPFGAEAQSQGGNEMPFEKEPFDAGVQTSEEEDPKKFIEQLSGKLGQSLRKYSQDQGQPDFKLEKFAVNSVLSATHTSEMNPKDQEDIIKKVKSSGEGDPEAAAPAAEPSTEPIAEPAAEPTPEAPKETDEQTLVEMSMEDTNAKILMAIYNRGGEDRRQVVRAVTYTDNDNLKDFITALRDYTDYSDLHDIFTQLRQNGVEIPSEAGGQKQLRVAEKFQDSEKLRIFETKNMEQPVIKPAKPETKPSTPVKEPSRRDKPFLPAVTPGVQPDPKATK